MRFALICAAWPAFCAAGFAQEDDIAVERPFLWQMQSPGSDQVSHLFGTIHVNHPGITRLHPKAQSAFDACDAAYFEIDFVRDNDAQVKAVSLPEGQTLEQQISTRTVERIDHRLKKLSPLLARQELPEFHVVLWPIMLASLEAQVRYLGTMPLDLQLHQAAGKAGKVTGGLEKRGYRIQRITVDSPGRGH